MFKGKKENLSLTFKIYESNTVWKLQKNWFIKSEKDESEKLSFPSKNLK